MTPAGGEGVLVSTLCLDGARAARVEMELRYTGGLMQRIIMTGLPGSAVREARDRIRGCLESCELPVPRRSVLVNFAPADLPKSGNGFDLPLALGLLTLEGAVPPGVLGAAGSRAVLGELALDGRLRPVRGALALAIEARRRGFTHLMLPAENGPEATLVRELEVEAVATLAEALTVLDGAPAPPVPSCPEHAATIPDLADVRGHPSARRALELAAAGRHHLLLHGPPGTGKTMLAQRLPGLLPALDEPSALEVSALHGLGSGGATRVLRQPPFRAPHHTITRAGLVGGGSPLVPGEVSLAHAGVLFLDEMAEFPRSLLESLRQPIEECQVRLARAGRATRFPSRFQLVGATNPCPCGYHGHPRRACRCTPVMVDRYRRRLSGPLLDRFDLCVEMPPPDRDDWFGAPPGEGSAPVALRVAAGRERRPAVEAHPSRRRVQRLLENAVTAFGLGGRSLRRLIEVGRTVAALDQRDVLAEADVEEALSFRSGLLGPT